MSGSDFAGQLDDEGRSRPRWLMVVLYVVSVALWVLASGLRPTIAIAGFFWAAVIRGIYVAVRRRKGSELPFWSPWVFVLAAICTVFTLYGVRASEQEAVDAQAVERGVVAKAEEATPVDRCVTKVVTQVEAAPAEQVANIPAGVSVEDYARDFCEEAERHGALATNGDVSRDDDLMRSACADAIMASFRNVPVEQRRFSPTDFRRFAERYCDEAINRDLLDNARSGQNQAELRALQEEVISSMLARGEITELGGG